MYLEVQNLWKEYAGSVALQGISLSIEQGKVVGILGENGAGKSTLFRIIANVSHPTRGAVLLNGSSLGSDTRQRVAYLPDIDPFYGRMPCEELFSFLNTFFENWNMAKAQELTDFMQLDRKKKIGALSKGQKARLKIICAFAQEPEMILMDEPLGGIDPVSRRRIMSAIFGEFKFGEQTILIATHLVDDVEEFLEDVVYLKDGKVAISGNTDQLRAEHNQSLSNLFEKVMQ